MEHKRINRRIAVVKNLVAPSSIDDLKIKLQEGINFYKSFDLFGQPVTLRYQGDDNYKSVVGATISMSIFGLMLAYFVWSFIIFLNRGSPIFSSVSELLPSPNNITFNNNIMLNSSMTAGLQIINNKGNKLGSFDDLLHSMFAFNVSMVTKSDLEEEKNPPLADNISCIDGFSQKNAQNKSYYDLFKMGSRKSSCFRIDKFNKIPGILTGTDISSSQTYIKIVVYLINPAKDNSNSNLSNGATVYFYYNQKIFDSNSSTKDIAINNTAYYVIPISTSLQKSVNLEIQNNSIIDYFDIGKSDPTAIYLLSYGDMTQEINYRNITTSDEDNNDSINSTPLLYIYIKLAKTKTTFTRKYVNVKEYAVDLSSIMNAIFMFGTIVGRRFNAMLMKVALINSSFNIISNGEEEQKKDEIRLNLDPKIADDSKSARTDDPTKNPQLKKTFNTTDKKNAGQNSTILKEDDKSNLDLKEEKKEDFFNEEEEERLKQLQREDYQMEYGKIINPWYCDRKMKIKKDKMFTPFEMGAGELIRMLIPCCQNTKIKNNKKIYEDCGLYIESFFDIQRIVGILREYQELRTVVMSADEYKILKLLTTPKIEIKGEEIKLKKIERFSISNDMNKNFLDFKIAINKLIRNKHLSGIEYSLLDLHKLDISQDFDKN